jgi:maleate cis-trans isomerase
MLTKRIKAHHAPPGVEVGKHDAGRLYHDYALKNNIATPEEIEKRGKEAVENRKIAKADSRSNGLKALSVNQVKQNAPVITDLQKAQIKKRYSNGQGE